MFRSIKKLLYSSFVVVGIALLLLTLLSVKQRQLTNSYFEVSRLSEQTIFKFTTIREEVATALIVDQQSRIARIIPEIELLNTQLSELFNSSIIPADFKLLLVDKIDLAGLVIELRGYGGVPTPSAELRLSLQKRLRLVAENLLKVDRLITQQMRDSVVRFQLSVIGILGIILSCSSFFLIMLYRRSVRPLLELSLASVPARGQPEPLPYPPHAGNEIIKLIDRLNEQLLIYQSAHPGDNSINRAKETDKKLAIAINEAVNSLNGILNYTQLLVESETISGDDRRLLEQIVVAAENAAETWQKQSPGFSAD